MSIDFSKVTAITTPSGSLSNIKRTSDSVQLWPLKLDPTNTYTINGLNINTACGIIYSGEYKEYKYKTNSDTDISAIKARIEKFNSYKFSLPAITVTATLKNPVIGTYNCNLGFGMLNTDGDTGGTWSYGNTTTATITSTDQTTVDITFNSISGTSNFQSFRQWYIPGFAIDLNRTFGDMVDTQEIVNQINNNITLYFS